MKLFKVLDETDGATTREPGTGKVSTEIIRAETFYAAESIEAVWDHIAWMRRDPERTVVLVAEVAPMVEVIQSVIDEAGRGQ